MQIGIFVAFTAAAAAGVIPPPGEAVAAAAGEEAEHAVEGQEGDGDGQENGEDGWVSGCGRVRWARFVRGEGGEEVWR